MGTILQASSQASSDDMKSIGPPDVSPADVSPSTALPEFLERLGIAPTQFEVFIKTQYKGPDDWACAVEAYATAQQQLAKGDDVYTDFLAFGFTDQAASAARQRIGAEYQHHLPIEWAIADLESSLMEHYYEKLSTANEIVDADGAY